VKEKLKNQLRENLDRATCCSSVTTQCRFQCIVAEVGALSDTLDRLAFSSYYTTRLLVHLVAARVGVSSEMQADELSDVANQLRTMRQLIARLAALNVDPTEYACLKAIVLFKPGNYRLISL